MAKADTEYFEAALGKAHIYLEYGMGGSTRAALEAGLEVISVESDKRYCRAVAAQLGYSGRATLIHADIGIVVRAGRPLNTLRTTKNTRRWAKYVTAPWDAAAEARRIPDLVLIDGRFRVACGAYSLMQLRDHPETQVLVHDYAMRPSYGALEAICRAEMVSPQFARLRLGDNFSAARAAAIFDAFILQAL
ncbi:MAG: hypothetical protein WEB63_04030 [Cucumibacter sp.]